MLHPHAHFVWRAIPLALLSLFSTVASSSEEKALRDTVVTANRRATEIDQLSSTVTTIGRQEIDRRMPTDDADLFGDDPDVVMARDMRRHGATRVNIRGIEDNRVVQMVDGVRQPDYFNGGGPTNYTMSASSAPMTDFLRQVEIVRGPASSLYGSDAIGGVVGYLTLNPEDIAKGQKMQGIRLRGGYFGANDAFSGSLVGALRSERFDVLLGYAQAKGEETKNKGDSSSYGPNRSEPNPAETNDRGALAKFIFRPLTGHKLTASFEGREQESQTKIMRVPASLSRISAMSGDDETERYRYGLEYEHKDGLFYDRLIARTYRQDSKTHNVNQQKRNNARYTAATGCSASSAAVPQATCDIAQDFFFEQQTTGLGLQFESMFQLGGASNLLTYGIDAMRQRVETLRNGRITNTNTGAVTNGLAGETYPLRDFANGQTDTLGLYVQDEISMFAGRLSLTPGLRFDHTNLKPEVDALAQQVLTTIKRQAVEKEFSHVSPKIGGQWKFTETVSVFGQIASGFRAPNYNEVNGAFRNSSQIYASTPNPDLEAETSLGVEVGLRIRTSSTSSQITVFDNHYKNFIENVQLKCPSDPNCVKVGGVPYTTYMYKNLSNVRIYGAEARASWDFSRNWRLDGALAYANGENTDTGTPVNSIEPLRASFGLAYDVGQWGSEWRMRFAARKSQIDDSGGTYFRTPGYGVSDLAGWIKPTANTRVVIAVNNLFDQKYWLWADIRAADGTNPTAVDFYTQPGRNLRLSFQADF